MQDSATADDARSQAPAPPHGCFVCRSRKVRCDKHVPGCRNCTRLGLTCPGYSTAHEGLSRREIVKSAEEIFKAAGIKKRRVGACSECRATKFKCTKTRPRCRRCLGRGLECVYTDNFCERDGRSETVSSVDDIIVPPLLEQAPLGGARAEEDPLYSADLPEDPILRSSLIGAYFQREHPLRCLSFIHKPSFLHSLDRGSVTRDYGAPLVHAMCALGAMRMPNPSRPLGVGGTRFPGSAWVEKAYREVLTHLHAPTVQQLMTMILICEYGVRTDQNAMVFGLTGLLFRTMRLLGLDSPSRSGSQHAAPSSIEREIKNRIVWACYITDIIVASGVDHNSSWRQDIPQLPLPWPDQNFLSQTSPSAPMFLGPILQSPSLDAIQNLDLPALYIILTKFRGLVLRFIRQPPNTDAVSGDSSPFNLLLRQLQLFYQNLPDRYRLTDLNMYVLDDQNNLGAALSMHLMYHTAVMDLTRVTLPGFTFPLATAFQHVSPEFLSQCQARCRFHADEVAQVVRQGLRHRGLGDRGRVVLDTCICDSVSLESAKIQIIHAAAVRNDAQSVENARHNLRTLLQLQDTLNAGKGGQTRSLRTIISLCWRFGFQDVAEEWTPSLNPAVEMSAEVTGSAEVHHLSSAAIFRRALVEIGTDQSGGSSSSSSQAAMGTDRDHYPANDAQRGLAAFDEGAPAQQQSLSAQLDNMGDRGDMAPMMPITPLSPSVEAHTRMAYELSAFLTWDTFECDALPWTEPGWVS